MTNGQAYYEGGGQTGAENASNGGAPRNWRGEKTGYRPDTHFFPALSLFRKFLKENGAANGIRTRDP